MRCANTMFDFGGDDLARGDCDEAAGSSGTVGILSRGLGGGSLGERPCITSCDGRVSGTPLSGNRRDRSQRRLRAGSWHLGTLARRGLVGAERACVLGQRLANAAQRVAAGERGGDGVARRSGGVVERDRRRARRFQRGQNLRVSGGRRTRARVIRGPASAWVVAPACATSDARNHAALAVAKKPRVAAPTPRWVAPRLARGPLPRRQRRRRAPARRRQRRHRPRAARPRPWPRGAERRPTSRS